MSRFEQIIDPPNNSELNDIYQEMVETGVTINSKTPINWFTSQSIRPDILEATWEFSKAIFLEGQLPFTLKEMIILAISVQNNCEYCAVTHTQVLESLGVSQEVIESCRFNLDSTAIPPVQQEVLRFALKAAVQPLAITNDDYELLRDYGLSDEEILEIIAVAVSTNFINSWADTTALLLDK